MEHNEVDSMYELRVTLTIRGIQLVKPSSGTIIHIRNGASLSSVYLFLVSLDYACRIGPLISLVGY